jgi:aldose 1-epimerase
MRCFWTAVVVSCVGLKLCGCDGPSQSTLPAIAEAAPDQTEATSNDIPTNDTPTETTMLTVHPRAYGTTPSGEKITLYTLSNQQGLKVELINWGGILVSVQTPDRSGKLANITLSFANLDEYLVNGPYFGGICGRFANRIAFGKFTLDGQEYSLATNNGPHHLHGGTESFMKRVWAHEPIQSEDECGVRLRYTSPDGEEGYPGTLSVQVTYTLNNRNELKIDYVATTDRPTVLNLTNHAYWNLTGDGRQTIVDHQLTLAADEYLPVDEGSIPTGAPASVVDTPMDFREPHKIGERLSQTVNGGGGYDHCYVVRGHVGTLRPCATIVEPVSGRVMEIETTEPGVQFYTGNYLAGTAETGNAVRHGAFCLETQHYPDSPNRPEYPTTVLRPGETYRQTTVHRFKVQSE